MSMSEAQDARPTGAQGQVPQADNWRVLKSICAEYFDNRAMGKLIEIGRASCRERV